MPVNRSRLSRRIDEFGPELSELALKIHAHPELGHQEFQAQAWISNLVSLHARVEVELKTGGLATAFRARVGSGHAPRVAVLAEYDALPELGHACGHNLIAGAAVGAFLGLADQAAFLDGSVELIGTPAEEGGGGKIRLLEAGVFEGLDAALMMHPFDRDLLAHQALACTTVICRFHGTPAHAAAGPWEGRSALTACLDSLRLVDSQRIHFRDGVRVHGLVRQGGQAVNIIPEYAACELCVRAPNATELERVVHVVERCARGAAMAGDIQVEVEITHGYREMVNNLTMARRFGEHLAVLGRSPELEDRLLGAASTDMGDVSQRLPAIHPYLAICERGAAHWHDRQFAECAGSERGLRTMLAAAKAMAQTLADLVEDGAFLAAVKGEFERTRNLPH